MGNPALQSFEMDVTGLSTHTRKPVIRRKIGETCQDHFLFLNPRPPKP